MMDKPAESSDEDRMSLKSNGRSHTVVKETLGMLHSSFKNSIRRVTERSPLSPRGQGSKVTPKAGSTGNESGTLEPPSPSEYRHGSWEFRNTYRQVQEYVRAHYGSL